MNGSDEKRSEERGIGWVPTTGSVIGGIAKEKTERITEAMADLQLGIDGLRGQLPGVCDGNRWAHALGAFARTCSVFLRKTVLGDRDRRETRLLDDRVLGSIGLQFDRLRKIPSDRRREIEVGFSLKVPSMNAVSHGNRPRSWDTRVGTIELAVPKVRPGSHYPSLLQPRRRAEQALRAWWGRLHGWSPGSDTEGMSQHTHTVTVRLAMGAPLVRRLDAVAARDDEPLQRGGTSAFRGFMSSGHRGVWSPRVAGMGDSLSPGYDGEYSRQPGTAEYSF